MFRKLRRGTIVNYFNLKHQTRARESHLSFERFGFDVVFLPVDITSNCCSHTWYLVRIAIIVLKCLIPKPSGLAHIWHSKISFSRLGSQKCPGQNFQRLINHVIRELCRTAPGATKRALRVRACATFCPRNWGRMIHSPDITYIFYQPSMLRIFQPALRWSNRRNRYPYWITCHLINCEGLTGCEAINGMCNRSFNTTNFTLWKILTTFSQL